MKVVAFAFAALCSTAAALDCSKTQTIQTLGDITDIHNCDKLQGDLIIGKNLTGDVYINTAEITGTISNEEYQDKTKCMLGLTRLRFDATKIGSVELRGLTDIQNITITNANVLKKATSDEMPSLFTIRAPKLSKADLFRVHSAPLLEDIQVSPGFRAGSPNVRLPDAGLEVKYVSCSNLTNLVTPQDDYGDISIDEAPELERLDIAVKNAGEISVRSLNGQQVTFVQFESDAANDGGWYIRKISVSGTYVSTSRYDAVSEPIFSWMDTPVHEVERLLDPHGVGIFEVTGSRGLTPRLFFRDIQSLVLKDNSLFQTINGTGQWQHYNMDNYTWSYNGGYKASFYWPEVDIKLLQVSGTFDAKAFEMYTKIGKWGASIPAQNLSKVERMVVRSDNKGFDCKPLRELTSKPVVIRELVCQGKTYGSVAVRAAPNLLLAAVLAAVMILAV